MWALILCGPSKLNLHCNVCMVNRKVSPKGAGALGNISLNLQHVEVVIHLYFECFIDVLSFAFVCCLLENVQSIPKLLSINYAKYCKMLSVVVKSGTLVLLHILSSVLARGFFFVKQAFFVSKVLIFINVESYCLWVPFSALETLSGLDSWPGLCPHRL